VISLLGDAGVDEVVEYVVAAQADPARHVTYVGDEPVSVRSDLAAAAQWRDRTLVARDDAGTITGVLTVDVDDDLGRLWWLGPWADDRATAAALLEAGRGLAAGTPEREFAPDARNTDLAELATSLGYRAEVLGALLRRDLAQPLGDDDHGRVRALAEHDRGAVARLHDQLFAGTHTRGRDLVRAAGTDVLVAGGDVPLAYVATQSQPDGTVYVDFLGVDPGARRRGLGRALVTAALRRARATGRTSAYLTVRTDRPGAIALYLDLGFVEERRIAPFRRGFSRDV
jgi:ribosomal protein S18 acetylase RimI-like enzyme